MLPHSTPAQAAPSADPDASLKKFASLLIWSEAIQSGVSGQEKKVCKDILTFLSESYDPGVLSICFELFGLLSNNAVCQSHVLTRITPFQVARVFKIPVQSVLETAESQREANLASNSTPMDQRCNPRYFTNVFERRSPTGKKACEYILQFNGMLTLTTFTLSLAAASSIGKAETQM